MAKSVKGKLITFEGSEGCGKSTQARLLCQHLKRYKRKVLHLREPGGVQISEKIRSLLLDKKNKKMCKACEVLLYLAARAQLVDEIILPEIHRGTIIVCDRFLDSTVAYQGYGCAENLRFIREIGWYVTKEIKPDLTFLLDMEPCKSLSRIQKPKDRIEQRPLSYHQRVRQGYLEIAKEEPRRVKVIPAHQSREEIQSCIQAYISRLLKI